jgi:hypothetical protein
MSAKWIGIYSGFFLGIVLLTLLATGVLQHGILPRLRPHGAAAAPAAPEEKPPKAGADALARPAAVEPTPPSAGVAPPGAAGGGPVAGLPAKPATAAATPPDRSAHVKRLARLYEGMRPKEAASVIEKLERPLAARVLLEVKDRQAAKIFGAMDPATAADLTRLLGQPEGGVQP